MIVMQGILRIERMLSCFPAQLGSSERRHAGAAAELMSDVGRLLHNQSDTAESGMAARSSGLITISPCLLLQSRGITTP